ncbi:MAG: hypothetical protein JST00_41595 [Deltaproteobacteria bacterium]|nr:hypothetical protein [Deltaproteobacteria bacterium]
MRARPFGRVLFALTSLTIVGLGCSAIVSSDVPQFKCSTPGSTTECPPGQSCNESGLCVVATDGTAPDDAGEETSTEDASDGEASTQDVDAGPLALGTACRVNGDCQSKLCGTSTILTNAITGTPGPICTKPCCTSTECPSDFVCINAGTGGGYCVPKGLAQRDPPGSAGKGPGATCGSNRECRSGLCDIIPAGGPSKRCVDTCCGDSDCTGTVCRLVKAPMPSVGSQHSTWICAPQAGAKNPGTSCVNQPECKSEVCLPVGGGSCRPACSSTARCRALGGTFAPDGRCVYGFDPPDYFLYCQEAAGGATLAKGQACSTPGECISGYCDAETGKCLEVCARDADCLSTESCKPSSVTTPFLRCVPK